MAKSPADLLTFYAGAGVMTDPGEHGQLFDGLPADFSARVQYQTGPR